MNKQYTALDNPDLDDPSSFAAIAATERVADETSASASFGSPRPELSLVAQYWRIVKRRKWTVIGSIVLAVLVSLVLSMLMTRQYTATATVEIARDEAKILNVESVRSEVTTGDQEFYQTQYGLLKSRALAERVVAKLKLTRDPRFRDAFGLSEEGDAPLVFGTSKEGSAALVREARNILLDNVDVAPVRLSRLVDVSFTSPDPALSAQITNAWAEAFIESNIQRGFDETAFARRFLEERLASTRDKLEQSERQAVDYASRERLFTIDRPGTKDAPSTSRSLTEDDLVALTAELSRATADRLAAAAAYANKSGPGQSALLNNTALGSLRERRATLAAEYQKLMVQFEPGYPAARQAQEEIRQLDRSIASEEARIGSTGSRDLLAAYNASRDREASLRREVNEKTGQLLSEKRDSIQFTIYQREADTNRQLYDALLQRYKELGAAGGAARTNVSVVDRADVPISPSKPNIPLNLFIALVLGVIIGFVLIVVREQIDVAVSDPTDVQRLLGLPILGVIPDNPVEEDSETIVEALADRKSTLSEAYLSLRTTISFTTTHGIPATIAVTSTRPREGKSTSAYALARLIASSGKKTLLIDCDMRSPSVHHLVGGDNSVGLSTILSGQGEIEPLLRQGPEKTLSVLAAGPTPPSAAELLASSKFGWLLDTLRRQHGFDNLILDSPPVIGLADALIVAGRAEATIYVVEAHATRVNQVLAAIQRLSQTNANIIGIALTKFRSEKSALTYDYGYGYGSDRAATA